MRAPKFWYGKSVGARVLAALLSPLAVLYRAGVALKPKRRNPMRAHAKVVCIGNLTLGGTGKTPVAIALAEIFSGGGVKVVFLSRGYRGRLAGPVGVDLTQHSAADVGDEPLLLARTAPTIVSRDRAAGAVMADALGAEIVILDDGHQNYSLQKDLSFVVVDAAIGFGNGRLFPAGPLREPIGEGLARADAAIVVGEGEFQMSEFTGPILRARLVAAGQDAIAGKKLLAFAGIGRPEKFFATLKKMGGEICASRRFADHRPYSENEIRKLHAHAARLDAQLVTTQKDFVRIADHQREGIFPLPVRAEFENARVLAGVLKKLTDKTVRAKS
jgi:tetraacyldisaccharide 4'-kinase